MPYKLPRQCNVPAEYGRAVPYLNQKFTEAAIAVNDIYDFLYSQTVNVRDYGVDPTSGQDSTAGFQAAINAAKDAFTSPSFGGNFNSAYRVFIPPGIYAISSLDCTACTGLYLYAIPGTVVLYGAHQASTSKPILDFTGSSNIQVHGVIVAGQDAGGNDPPIIPSCGILLAESNTSPGDSNKNHISQCGSLGKFTSCAVGVVGSTDNKFDFCAFQNMKTDRPVLVISTQPDWSLSSPYITIQDSASNVGDQTFVGCEFHAHNSSSGTECTTYMRDVDNVRFFGGNSDNSATRHVFIQGSTSKNLLWSGVKFYSESGHAADDMLTIDTALTGFVMLCPNTEDNAFSDKMIEGSGSIAAGCIRGVRKAALSGALLYQCTDDAVIFGETGLGVVGGSTVYFGTHGSDAAENNVTFLQPYDGVYVGFQAVSGGSPSAGQTYTSTLRVGNADSAMVATISGTGTTGSDITNVVQVSAGQRIAIKLVTSAAASALASINYSVTFIRG